MAIQNPTITAPTDPKLWDYVLSPFQIILEGQLSWLDTAYGKAETRSRERDGALITYPAVYANSLDYLSVLPDGHLGNYTFFAVQDGWDLDQKARRLRITEAQVSLIGWYDIRSIYPADWQQRTNQHIIAEVFDAIRYTTIQGASFRVGQVYEQGQNIYQGFTSSEIPNQYLMRPFGGFRIDLIISFDENCV